MFKRLAEKLLGLEPGYFNQPGELGRHWFDPHWPGPLFGTPGSWHNYLLALLVLALIVLLFRRFRNQRWVNQQDAVAAGLATVVCLIFLAAFGVHAWTLVPALFVLGLLAYFLFKRRWRGVLNLGRLMLFALLLSFLSGALAWNVTLSIAAALLIIWVYRHEGRSRGARISLGILRGALAAFVLILLNNPILSRVITITQPSVVAVLVDHSLSMSIHDVDAKPGVTGPSRLESAVNLLDGQNQALLKRLGEVHTLRFYSFDSSPRPLGDYSAPKESEKSGSSDDKTSDQERPTSHSFAPCSRSRPMARQHKSCPPFSPCSTIFKASASPASWFSPTVAIRPPRRWPRPITRWPTMASRFSRFRSVPIPLQKMSS